MCLPSPVASRAWNSSAAKWGSRVSYLGIVGDQAHQVRVSGHNCGALQESSLEHPGTGVTWNYPDPYAHALDIGHGGNRALAAEIRNAFLTDPRRRVRYVIDNGVVYYPAWRGGGTSSGSGHSTHVHISFTPWSTHDVAPFFGPPPRPLFPIKKGSRGFHVLVLEILLVHCGFPKIVVDGRYGSQTAFAASKVKRFLRRGGGAQVTEADLRAIANWVKMTGGGSIKTLNDRGPGIAALRDHLRELGQDIKPGVYYDARTQKAVQNVQRFFDLKHKAGNATSEDRAFIRHLARRA